MPDSELPALAAACGVDVTELAPTTDRTPDDTAKPVIELGGGVTLDTLLREYVAMISELRSAMPGSRLGLREEDLDQLATVLGGTAEAIEARLGELTGADADETHRLRSIIVPSGDSERRTRPAVVGRPTP